MCTECEPQAGEIFFECFDAGGTGIECRALMEPVVSECALTCEGTEDEKASACNVARQVQISVCLDAEEDDDSCIDETLVFFNECVGEINP